MNGNKHIIGLFAVLLFLSACFEIPGRPTPHPSPPGPPTTDIPPKDTIVKPPDKVDPPVIPPKKDSVDIVIIDSNQNLFLPEMKATYKLAIILPFAPDERKLLPFMGSSDKANLKGLIASEYYAGIKMGLDTLKNLGVSLDVSVWDSRKDPQKVKEILMNPKLFGIDAVLGPVYNRPLQITVEHFQNQPKVRIFSPLSPAMKIVENNPSFHVLTSNPKARAMEALRVLDSLENQLHFIKINDSRAKGQPNDSYEMAFQELGLSAKGHSITTISSNDATYKPDDIQAAMLGGKKQVIILDSEDQSFVSQMITNTKGAMRKMRTEVILLGSGNWINKDHIALDVLETLNFHGIAPYYVDYETRKVQNFVKAYNASYGTKPSHFSFKGYDHILFIGTQLHKYGTGLNHQFDKQHDQAKLLYNRIEQAPIQFLNEETGSIQTRCSANRQVTVAKYQDGRFVKLN